MKVLYVEDNPANVFLVKRVAKVGKHEIINFIDGDVALKKFDEVNPDLVLMDIQLAGNKSGLDVVKALRARGVKTAIIAVTAYAMVGDKERCLAAGCDDYMAKPLPVNRLVEIFKHYSDLAEKTAPTSTKEAAKPALTSEDTVAETPQSAEVTDSSADAQVTETPTLAAAPEEAPTEATKAEKAPDTTPTQKAIAEETPVAKKPSDIDLSESDRTLPVRPVVEKTDAQTVSPSDTQNSVQSSISAAETTEENPSETQETPAEPVDQQ